MEHSAEEWAALQLELELLSMYDNNQGNKTKT